MQFSSRKYLIGLSLFAGLAFVGAACSRVERTGTPVAGGDVPAATAAPGAESVPPPVVADTTPESTPPPTVTPPTSASASASAPFGAPQTIRVGESVVYSDGLTVELNKIDDSRCPANVQCIWAGQLAPELALHGGDLHAAQTISLGTVRAKTQVVAPYGVTLVDSSTDSATLTVIKSDVATTKVP